MQRKKIWKRALSLALCFVMALSVGISPLPEGILSLTVTAAETTFPLSKSDLALGAPVVPKALDEDSTFKDSYIRGGTMSLNSYFKMTTDSNTNQKTGNVLTRSKIMHESKGSGWKAIYKWDCDEAQEALLKDTSYTLKYEANGISENYTRSYWKGLTLYKEENRWDWVSLEIKNSSNRTMWSGQSYAKNSGQAQPVSWSGTSLETDYIEYIAKNGNESAMCGESGVSGSTFWLVDNSIPRVTDAYICTDSNNASGTKVSSGGFSVSSAVTSYVVFEFSEKVRFSDNKGEVLSLNLDARDNNSRVDMTIKADLVSFDGQKMIFKYTVNPTTNGNATDITIKGISSAQSTFANGSFDLYLYDADGNKASTGNQKSACYITDIAGNSLDWGNSDKYVGNITYDNIAPTVTDLSMSGNFITTDSLATTDGLSDGASRSAIFAGNGDWIQFSMTFSENVSITTSGTMYMVLNVKDSGGNAIKLECTASGNSITSEKLNITETTFDTSAAGERIRVAGMEGITKITDSYGNAMVKGDKYTANLSSVTLEPAQGIYVDIDAPLIETGLTAAEGAYTPTTPASYATGEYFVFPININENTLYADLSNTSYIEGQKAYFSIVSEANAGMPFSWYVSNSDTLDTGKFQAGTFVADNITKYSYVPIQGQIAYLFVKLDKNEAYKYVTKDDQNGVFFEAEIYVTITDNAGNTSTKTFPICHQVDSTSPGGSIASAYTHSIDYTNLSSTITSNFSVWDDLGIKEIKYSWTYTIKDASNVETTKTTDVQTIDLSSSMTKEYSGEVSLDIPFGENDDSGRAGSAYLTISYTDFAGFAGGVDGSQAGAEAGASVNSVYTFDFTQAQADYRVVGGTKVNPLTAPEVYLSAPVSTGATTNRTILLIPYSTNEDGSTNYFVYDPLKSGSSEASYDGNLDLINDLLEETNIAGGEWKMLTGTVADGAGTFTSCETLAKSDICNFISGMYGSFEILFVTSSEFDSSKKSFSDATSTIESTTVYLANNAVYTVEITGVKDNEEDDDSADAMSKLAYEKGNVPATNLDEVEISLSLTNTTATEAAANYGFIPLDFSNSKIELLYYGGDTTLTGETIYTWKLARATEQYVVIPEGTATQTGWYGLQITITNMNGTVNTTRMQQFYFMDNREIDISLDAYYKEYDNENTTYDPIVAEDESASDWTDDSPIEVSLGTAPEGWTVDTYFTFNKGKLTNGSDYGIQELVKVRVYNINDADYETNAIWVDANEIETLKYTPVYAETITAESYGTKDNLLLPLYDGRNYICYELVNTNGVVKSHKVEIFAYAECEEWDLNVEYTEISERTGGIMEVTVSPSVSENIDLEKSYFNYVENKIGNALAQAKKNYVFRDDFNYEFWLLDQNGNLDVRSYAVADVDGTSPDYVGFTTGTMYNTDTNEFFHFIVYAYDAENAISADELTLTFDADYSAVLMGLSGDDRINNTQQITMNVPINREKDENGEYLPWESFEPGNNGIYRTKLLHEGPYDDPNGDSYDKEGYIEVEIWGTWKYDADADINVNPDGAEKYTNAGKRELTFTVLDENGNSQSATRTYPSGYQPYNNTSYNLLQATLYKEGDERGKAGTLNIYEAPFLDENGQLGAVTDIPFSKIYSYGASAGVEVEWTWNGSEEFYFTLPMIQEDGYYTLQIMDLFGDIHEVPLTVDTFGDLGISATFSETEYTNEDVTVSVVATLEGDTISSIKAVTESNEEVEGSISTEDATLAYVTLPENGTVLVTTALGKERSIAVSNIDKTLKPATIVWIDSMGCELKGTETALDEEVTAIVSCSEDIEGIGCDTKYTFPRGSKKGDTYTFTYMDAAGNEGTITATLPCDISEIEREEDFVDEEAPLINVRTYGMRNNKYLFITEIADPNHMYVEDGEAGYDYDDFVEVLLHDEYGIASYTSQAYKLILTIEDDSATKIVVQSPGTAAPTSYAGATEGSTVADVSVSGNAITISENVEFDLYIIDEVNNVTAVTGIKVASIDKEAPKYEVIYDVQKVDDNDYVYAVFVPAEDATLEETLEMIYPLEKSMPSIDMTVGEDDAGNPILRARYYYVFTENGTKTFRYVDEYGNSGSSEASVQGFSTAAPSVTSEEWAGTTANVKPAESEKVSNDVVATINTSKAISAVNLYWYDADAENGKGAEVPATEPVSVSFSGTSTYVTYTANAASIVVELIAKENGKVAYWKLSEVSCIDKESPVITVESAVLSDSKRYMTITLKANEKVAMSEYQKNENMFESHKYEFKTEYIWIATDAGEKTLHFTDEAGNKAEYTITQNSAVDTVLLTSVYSATEAHTDETTNPAKDFVLEVGDSVWVKTNKAATVAFGEEPATSVSANTWTKLVIPNAEAISLLKLTDTNTGEISYKTISVQPKDMIAPEITFASDSIVLNEDATMTELLSAIRSGVTIVDNKDENITTFDVTGGPSAVEPGLYELVYSAADSAGNVVEKYRTLYIMEEDAAVLYVNGEPALPFGRIVVDSHDLKLSVEGYDDLDLVTIKIRDGFRSVGQMKHSTTTIENLETTVSQNGFYTIHVRTQDRAEYVTYLYVEE